MNPTSSSANTLVGSAIARVRTFPIRLIGSTLCFLAICSGTSLSTSGSGSTCATVMAGIAYCFDRNETRLSSVMKLRRTRIVPSLSALPFCSASARWSWSGLMSFSATSRSPRRDRLP